MAQYHFDMPEGWRGVPLPAPHVGVQIRPGPDFGEPTPQTRAVIVLLGPVPGAGPLSETLTQMVEEGCAGAVIVRRGEPLPFRSVAFAGLLSAVRLRLPGGGPDEGRIFAVLDAGAERLPVVFAGGPDSLPLHRPALDLVLSSLRPHVGGPGSETSPFAGWTG